MKIASWFRAMQHAAAQAFTPHQHLYTCPACRQILQSLIDRRMALERYGQAPWELSPRLSDAERQAGMSGAATVCTPGGAISSNLGLCSPAANEVGWAAAINNNWTILDALFSVSGKLATPSGGTGLASPAAGSLLVGAGGSPMTALSPGVVSSMLMSTGTTPIWSPGPQAISVLTGETRTSSTYGDLATVGPNLTLTPSVTGNILVILASAIATPGSATIGSMSVALSGGNTLAAGDTFAVSLTGAGLTIQASYVAALFGLANASTLFRCKYRGDNVNPTTFANRRLALIPF